ncbi:MAG TPA: hypothetical protein VIE36_13455 [Methylomirabilota bacterium]|jgi:hypothetical protein
MSKLALVLTVCLIALAGVGGDAAAADSAADEAAYGAGAVLGTLLYAPLKTSFCIAGGVTSVLTFPFADATTAEKVATAACGGTWAITPQVLKGREPVRFVGGRAKPLVSARN